MPLFFLRTAALCQYFRQFSADTGAAAGAGTKVDLGFRLADVRFQAAGLPLLSN